MTAIWTVTESRFYTHWTTTLALRKLAEEKGLEFAVRDLDQFKAREWPELRDPLVVLHAAHLKIAHVSTDELRASYPGCRLVVLGSDSLYYVRKYKDEHRGLLVDPRGFEFCHPESVDLYLDLMQEGVEAFRALGVKADRWYWTASDAGLALAREVAQEPAPWLAADCVCYANPNVSAPGGYRKRLTYELGRRGLSILWGGTTEFVTLDPDVLRGIYRYYRKAAVCLGTSSPSWQPDRSMKGWRDWFAPALGLPLIYDDIEEMKDGKGPITGPPPVEHFGYEDWDGLAKLIRWHREEYDTTLYLDRVCRQQDWADDNTLEKQFARVFDKYGLL